jgi:serine acetyltransferase
MNVQSVMILSSCSRLCVVETIGLLLSTSTRKVRPVRTRNCLFRSHERELASVWQVLLSFLNQYYMTKQTDLTQRLFIQHVLTMHAI